MKPAMREMAMRKMATRTNATTLRYMTAGGYVSSGMNLGGWKYAEAVVYMHVYMCVETTKPISS